MLPQGVHFIAAWLLPILLGIAVVLTNVYWGGGWRVAVVFIVAFLPMFIMAHMIAERLYCFVRWLSDRRKR